MRANLRLVLLAVLCWTSLGHAAQVVTLNDENFEQAAAPGPEADAVYGDYAFTNDRIAAVIGNPELIGGRSSSRSSPQLFDACVIDLTLRNGPGRNNDLLAWYSPGPRFAPHASDFTKGTANYNVDYARNFKPVTGASVAITLHTIPWSYRMPPAHVRYTLEDGWRYLLCETIYSNPLTRPEGPKLIPQREAAKEDGEQVKELADGPRDGVGGMLPMPDEVIVVPPAGPTEPEPAFQLIADGFVERGIVSEQRLTWVYNKWFGQAYGVLDAATWTQTNSQGVVKEYDAAKLRIAGKKPVLQPGEELTVARRLIVGRDLFEVREVANEVLGVAMHRIQLTASASDGPVAEAEVSAWITPDSGEAAGKQTLYGAGRTDSQGAIEFNLPAGTYELRFEPPGRKPQIIKLDPAQTPTLAVQCEPAARVEVAITDEQGGPIPCKIEVRGRDGTPDPNFFPNTGDRAIGNLRYTENGLATQILPPGKYDVIVTRGPEFDMNSYSIDAVPGKVAKVTGKLKRSVDSTGWISADFHGYSTLSNKPAGSPPSAASTLGRVLNLLAEQVEFAPTTELNKVFTYEPIVAELGAQSWLKSCPGIALNDGGRKYAFNEQYSFPIVYKPRWQDGGAPQRPQHCGQIEWLRSWGVPIKPDAPWHSARQIGYEKAMILMQPDNKFPKALQRRVPTTSMYHDRDMAATWNDESAHVQPMFRDTDGDNIPDRVRQPFASLMDALDVRTLAPLLAPGDASVRLENDVVDWMLMRQNAYRMTGVISSGATHNFHGSGGVRNYVRSQTDDPQKIDPLDVVRAVRAGQVVMTTGPFLEATIQSANGQIAGPGQTVATSNGEATLKIKVQCPNWITLDSVHVLLDNQRSEKLEFNRSSQSQLFGQGNVQFEQNIPLSLSRDTQVIVLALGHGPNLRHRKNAADNTSMHAAITNPILVDFQGDGFVPGPPHLDEVESELFLLRPLLSRPGAPAARVRLAVTNHSEKAVSGKIPVVLKPATTAKIKGAQEFPFSLEANGKMTAEFDVELSQDAQADAIIHSGEKQDVTLTVPRDGRPPGVAPARLQIVVDDSPRASVPNGPK